MSSVRKINGRLEVKSSLARLIGDLMFKEIDLTRPDTSSSLMDWKNWTGFAVKSSYIQNFQT